MYKKIISLMIVGLFLVGCNNKQESNVKVVDHNNYVSEMSLKYDEFIKVAYPDLTNENTTEVNNSFEVINSTLVYMVDLKGPDDKITIENKIDKALNTMISEYKKVKEGYTSKDPIKTGEGYKAIANANTQLIAAFNEYDTLILDKTKTK